MKVFKNSELKKVSKPWGHELWINGEHPGYALKEIFIKAGNKTSLQYHRKKRETNVLVSGSIKLHYRESDKTPIDQVSSKDIAAQELRASTVIDVFPNHLHRIEAVTDATLYEVSTPHLDDVVRVSDDTGRGNGRIEAEHKGSTRKAG